MEEKQTRNRVGSTGSIVLEISDETESCDRAAAQTKLTISQNVEAQQFTQSPVPDIAYSPCPISPVSPHCPDLYMHSLLPYPDLPSGLCLTSPASSKTPTLLTPHPYPVSPSTSQYSTLLHSPSWQTSETSSPGPRLPTSSACPISSTFSPIFSPFSPSPASLIQENINNPLHNQSSHDQQAKTTFQNYGQASQLSQAMQSFTSRTGYTNTINSAVASIIPMNSSVKKEVLLSNSAQQIQLMQDTSVSQVHQNDMQFHPFNLQGYQHSNEIQQNTSLWEHQNSQNVQCSLQSHQQNSQGHQQNPLFTQQNSQGHQQNPQFTQQNSLGHQQNPQFTQQNSQGHQQNPQFTQQNSLGHQQNPLFTQQNSQGHQHNPQFTQQNSLGHQQNPLFTQQNLLGLQQNPLFTQQNSQGHQQNPQFTQQNSQGHQQNPQFTQHNLLDHQMNPQMTPQNYLGSQQDLPENPHMIQQYAQIYTQSQQKPPDPMNIHPQPQQTLNNHHQISWQSQHSYNSQSNGWQNLQTNQPNILQPQTNLKINQQNTGNHQHNFLSDQHYLYQPQLNLQISEQTTLQPQENFQTNVQNPGQPEQNLLINEQNAFLPQQNTMQPQENLLINHTACQPQHTLWTSQQNSYQPLQNEQINQQNALQFQQNLQITQQNPYQLEQNFLTNGKQEFQSLQDLHNQQNIVQPVQDVHIDQQNALQFQQNMLESQQYIDLNQQNTSPIQQNVKELDQHNTPQIQQSYLTHQEDLYQCVQNLPANQQKSYQPQQNLQGKQNMLPYQILQPSQLNISKAIQNSEHTWQQQNQHSIHPYNQESGVELSIQQTASNLNPLDRDMDISLNCASASVSHQSGKVKKQMSSEMLPEHAVQTGHPTSSSCTELLKYLRKNQETAVEEETMQIASQFSCWVGEFITRKLFPDSKSLINISYMDIQENQEYSQFLQELSTLGRLAASDLKKLQKNQRQHKSMLTDKASDCGASSRIAVENKWDDLIKSADICHQKVNELESNITEVVGEWFESIKNLCQEICKLQAFSDIYSNANPEENLRKEMIEQSGCSSLLQHLSDVCSCLIDFSEKWRGLETWKYVQLTLTPDDATVKTRYDEFGAMYTTYFDCLRVVESRVVSLQEILLDAGVKSKLGAVKQKLYKIKFKLLSVSWFYEKQPPTCSLSSDKKDLNVRLFGVTRNDIDEKNSQIYVFPQADYENRIHEQYLCKDSSIKLEECSSTNATSKQEVVLVVNIQPSINFKRRSESLCFEQLRRICLVIKLKTNLGQDIEPKIECCSLPFALRTGSSQLWESIGSVLWCCYFERNLYKPSPQLKKKVTIDQVVSMLQTVISARDPQRILDQDEVTSLKRMLKPASHENEMDMISLKEFAKDPLIKQAPKQGRQPTKQQKQSVKQGRQPTEEGKQPIKQGKKAITVDYQPRDTSKKCQFSFFGWFMAAVNSYMYLKSCKMSGRCFFLNHELCPVARNVSEGSALIRASRSIIEEPGGKNPYANLTVHVYSGRRSVMINVAVQTELNTKPNALVNWLEMVLDENDIQIIRTILPENSRLEDFKDFSNDEEQTNNYRTRYKKLPNPTIILRHQFEAISLYADK